jgi:hypothetical protein
MKFLIKFSKLAVIVLIIFSFPLVVITAQGETCCCANLNFLNCFDQGTCVENFPLSSKDTEPGVNCDCEISRSKVYNIHESLFLSNVRTTVMSKLAYCLPQHELFPRNNHLKKKAPYFSEYEKQLTHVFILLQKSSLLL